MQTQSNDFWTAIKKSLLFLALHQTCSTFHLLTTTQTPTHTHTHHSSQIGFPHWSYATAAGANQTLRCPNIPDIPALFQTHKLNLWTHLFACQWPKREKQSTAFIWPRCSRSTAWLTTRAITTLALPDSRKTYAKVMTRSTVSGLLHVGPQGKGKNMRKEKEQRIDMLCRFNS